MKSVHVIKIDHIELEVIINVKKIKKVYMRVKYINNKYYFVINSYKKLSKSEIDQIAIKHHNAILKLIKNINIKKENDNEILILGKVYNIDDVSKQLIENAYQEIINIFNYYKTIFNKQNTVLKFRKMRSRWGVCFINKDYITLTKATIHLPKELIEYIIIHEFCHFLYPNHSKQFYECVSIYCPDYKNKTKKLKTFSYTLNS